MVMGMFSTGRRSKKLTEKETGAVDDGTMMTDGGMVKGVGSGLGDIGMSGCKRRFAAACKEDSSGVTRRIGFLDSDYRPVCCLCNI